MNKMILIVGAILFVSIAAAQIQLPIQTDSRLYELTIPSPESSGGGGGNSSVNQSLIEELINATAWTLDGQSGPPSANWDMGGFGFDDVGDTTFSGIINATVEIILQPFHNISWIGDTIGNLYYDNQNELFKFLKNGDQLDFDPSEFQSDGIVFNTANGHMTGGNSLSIDDIPIEAVRFDNNTQSGDVILGGGKEFEIYELTNAEFYPQLLFNDTRFQGSAVNAWADQHWSGMGDSAFPNALAVNTQYHVGLRRVRDKDYLPMYTLRSTANVTTQFTGQNDLGGIFVFRAPNVELMNIVDLTSRTNLTTGEASIPLLQLRRDDVVDLCADFWAPGFGGIPCSYIAGNQYNGGDNFHNFYFKEAGGFTPSSYLLAISIDYNGGSPFLQLPGDNYKSTWGATSGGDMSMTYNGTDGIINPKEIGNGKLHILGDVVIDEGLEVKGNMTFTNSTLTGVNTLVFDTNATINSNATCLFLRSPDGSTILEACNV